MSTTLIGLHYKKKRRIRTCCRPARRGSSIAIQGGTDNAEPTPYEINIDRNNY